MIGSKHWDGFHQTNNHVKYLIEIEIDFNLFPLNSMSDNSYSQGIALWLWGIQLFLQRFYQATNLTRNTRVPRWMMDRVNYHQ